MITRSIGLLPDVGDELTAAGKLVFVADADADCAIAVSWEMAAALATAAVAADLTGNSGGRATLFLDTVVTVSAGLMAVWLIGATLGTVWTAGSV